MISNICFYNNEHKEVLQITFQARHLTKRIGKLRLNLLNRMLQLLSLNFSSL
jgi:hypothetical protein